MTSRNKMILIHMHAALSGALRKETPAGNLRKSVNIIRLDAQFFLDVSAHFLCPGLRAENTCF